jgi:hypothetical protein
MVSKQTMNIVIGIMLMCLGGILTIGLLLSMSNGSNQVPVNTVTASNVIASTPEETATPPYTGVLEYCRASFQVTDPSKGSDAVVVSISINNTGDQTYSIGINDWVIEINNKTYYPYMSGDFESSGRYPYISHGNEGFATYAYLVDDKLAVGSPLKLRYKGLNNTSSDVVSSTIQNFVDQSTTVHKLFSTGIQATPIESNTPHVKTLADKEPDTVSDGMHTSEEATDNADTNDNTKSSDSSIHSIFDYCTWEARTTRTIGEYSKAPENQTYVIVTLKIDNTGDQTYSTNPGYWHLKVGDRYYQHSTETYDNAINHLSADVAPGGKLTTEIVYLVNGEPSVSDMEIYYDGSGSDRTIHS